MKHTEHNQELATLKYVKASNKFYWKMTKERIDSEIELILKKQNRTIILVASSMIVGMNIIDTINKCKKYLRKEK